MGKDIYNHFLTNLKQSKWGLLITLLGSFFLAVSSFPAYNTGLNPIEYILEDRLGFYIMISLLLIPIFITMLLLSQNYRFTKTRWLLMRKDRRIYILGDIFFIFCILLLGWIVCMLIIYGKYYYQLEELRKNAITVQNIPTLITQIKSNEWYFIVYPTRLLEWFIKPFCLLCVSVILGYLVNFMAMAKKDKNNVLIVIGLSMSFYLIRYVQSTILVLAILLIMAIISYKLSIKIWAMKDMGGSYAEN